MKVGRYSIEERKDRILRYLKKRNQRNFNKTIKYACRKTLADKRVRVRGRFAKNNEPDEYENEKKRENYCEENNTCYDDSIQIKYDDEEDWLEAAMSSLMYFPYVSS
ncbi:zinc finger protein CONSTANS-LIKE 1-like [Olea europaea var. sylvestris]|nr:zinc finger protein CONSTANS-LIKE 1-like [Olea europaea var. sylvestris]